MKKTLFLLLVSIQCLTTAFAGAQNYVSLPVLRTQAAQGWHQIYQANGREVVADADVAPLPEAKTCPLVQVEGLGSEIDDALFDVYRQMRGSSIYNLPCAINVDVLDEHTVYPKGNHLRGDIWLDQDEVYLDGAVPPLPPRKRRSELRGVSRTNRRRPQPSDGPFPRRLFHPSGYRNRHGV